MVGALHLVFLIDDHIVPQIVEPKFVVGTVSDIRGVCGLPLRGVQPVDDKADRKAEIAINLAHPFAVPPCKVVIHRNHVHAFSGKGVEVCGQDDGLGFSFAGLHFGNPALMEDYSAEDLHRKVRGAKYPVGSLAAQGKRFWQNIVKTGAVAEPFLEQRGLAFKLFLAHSAVFVCEREDFVAQRLYSFYFPCAIVAEQHFDKAHLKFNPFGCVYAQIGAKTGFYNKAED